MDYKPPKRIWLQYYGDGNPEYDGPVDFDEMCWCSDKVNKHDVEYVRPTQLQGQNTALQANNTKLVLRVRELEAEQVKLKNTVKWHIDDCVLFEKKVKELEQDGKRLDWIEANGKAIGGTWTVIDGDLRQAIDKAMVKERGE